MITEDIQNTVRSGSVVSVRKALKGVELEAADVDALLHLASINGSASVINHIRTLGEPSSEALAKGALQLAMDAKDKPAIALLADVADADINTTDGSGRTIFAHAVRQGKQKLIDALIERGADINQPDDQGHHPVYWAFHNNKAKAAKSLFDHGITLSSEQAADLIDHAPNAKLRERVIAAFLDGRVSAMSREEFVAKWGEIAVLDSPVAGCVDPLDNPIMKGRFTTAGYYSAASGKDPMHDALDWEAIDHAKNIAEAMLAALEGERYVPGSEGDAPYHAFIIPALGRSPKTSDFDAHVSDEAKAEAHGAYSTWIQSESTGDVLFTGDYFSEDEDFIEADTRALFMAANAVAKEHLTGCKKYMLYTDFVSFPVIFGGLDKYYNFVGLLTEAVWT